MASLIPSGSASGTGSMTLSAPVTNSNQTATLPDATGTVMVSGNQPAFSAYLSSNQTIANATITKVQCNTKTFDTASAYDNATNYRFTPLVAGYYQVIASLRDNTGSATGSIRADIYKNGTDYAISATPMTTNSNTATASALIYLNGSTDYIEFYCYQNSGTSIAIQGNSYWTYFSACLVRNA
jgi:hypothetical protein